MGWAQASPGSCLPDVLPREQGCWNGLLVLNGPFDGFTDATDEHPHVLRYLLQTCRFMLSCQS